MLWEKRENLGNRGGVDRKLVSVNCSPIIETQQAVHDYTLLRWMLE